MDSRVYGESSALNMRKQSCFLDDFSEQARIHKVGQDGFPKADPHKTFLQTTVPEKISSYNTEGDPEHNIAYMITIKEKPYIVHLKQQSFLSSVSVVYSYGKDDTKDFNSLSDQMYCNYNGYIAGFPNSLASLNICSGLRGTLQLKDISYGIEPMEVLSDFTHLIYEEKDYNPNIPLVGDNDAYSHNISEYQDKKSSGRPEYFKLFSQYLDIYIVVDKNLFDYMGSDIKTVTQKVIQIIGLVNTMLTQLKLTVIISAIEIWSNKNKISTFGNPNEILYRFLEWKSQHVSRPYHTTYLLAFKKHLIFRGATYQGKICNKDYAAGVALYPEGSSLESYTVSIVQLLGLNVGLSFDNTDICFCSGDVCTMSPEAVHSLGVKEFSVCSLDEFKSIASNFELNCLHNTLSVKPVYKDTPVIKKVCGNGVLEQGEQCDCGTAKNCTHKSCCDTSMCKLKRDKVCGSGECCTQSCKLKPAGVRCRKSHDECDFIEFCDGEQPHCVPDTYKYDGTPCNSGDSFCYGGKCRNTDKQCQNLIGGDTKGAPFACFDEINASGDRFGNCGSKPCLFVNVMCGKLVCTWPYKTLVNRANLSVIYTHIRDDMCVSTFPNTDKPPKSSLTTYAEPEDRDETFVEDGTACGPEMPEALEGTLEWEAGFRAGTPHSFQGTSIGRTSVDQKSAFPKHQFQLIFYISLPVLIIMIVVAIVIKQNKIKYLCYRGETESERSVSEENSSYSKLSPSESLRFRLPLSPSLGFSPGLLPLLVLHNI
ncbi:disintegrin and metalloproteinase domain-containing protein 5-like [Rhynchonycteris naso]